MYFWLDKTSESDNVIILSKNAVLIASCSEESYNTVFEQCTNNTHPYQVFGKDNILTIPFAKVQKIVSRSTDADVEIKHKQGKEIEDSSLDFETLTEKEKFIGVLSRVLPEHLTFTKHKQNRVSAAMWPLFSLLLSVLISYFYINKWRWVTIVVGGLWALGSVWMLYSRASNPPEISTWNLKGKYARKTVQAIKTGFSYIVVVVIAIAFSVKLPVSYGPSAVISHAEYGELEAEDVQALVDNGGDVNMLDSDGYTSLSLAIMNEDKALTRALIDQGANLSLASEAGETALFVALYTQNDGITHALLESGKPLGSLEGTLAVALSYEAGVGVLKKLVSAGANIQEEDDDKFNLLAQAIYHDAEFNVVKYVHSLGLDSDVSIYDKGLIEYAKDNGRLDIVSLLKSSSAADGSRPINAKKSVFLSQFIQDEEKSRGKSKGKSSTLLKLALMADGEGKLAYQKLVHNSIQVNAVGIYMRSQSLPHYAQYCAGVDPALGQKITLLTPSYLEQKQRHIRAGKEVIENNTVLNVEEKTVLAGTFQNNIDKKPQRIAAKFSGESKLTDDELRGICLKLIDKIQPSAKKV